MRTFLLIMQYIAIALLVVETGYVFIKWKTRIQGYLFLICLSTLGNSLGYLLAIHGTTLGEYLIGLKMSYFGRVWVGFSLLLFVNALCKRKNPRALMIPLACVHTAVFGIVATCEHHTIYYKNMYLDTTGIFPCLGKVNGIVHEAYNYLIIVYILYGVTILLYTTIKEKNSVQKKRLALVLAAVLADSGFYLVEVFGNTVGFDDTVLGYAVASVFMFIAIFRYSLLDTLKIVSDYVIDEVSEGIVAVNKKGEPEYSNKPAKDILSNLGPDGAEALQNIRRSAETQEPLLVGDKTYSAEARELIDDGTVAGTIYVLVDETEHYRYMEELREQKELAEQANASKSAFLSVVSHEIRTPMNAVVGMTELLLRESESLTDKQKKYLNNIRNSGSSLVMIVNDILDQSKIEAGKMEIVEDVYELRPMTEDVRMIIENRIGDKPIRLECDIDEKVPAHLVGDGLRIRQILINLMNNAVKFTEEGFIRLSIRCAEEGADKILLRFAVQDSGQGIRKEDLSKLGEAFSQVDTHKNHSKEGTGLGLSISRDFINMMGGALEVTSTYGEGSEFFFSIYQGIPEQGDDEEAGYQKQAWQADAEFTAPDARILVVDDNEINLMVMEECLNVLEVRTDTAQSGEAALALIAKNRYDLIFMDYVMPYMDGVETTRKIRAMATEAAQQLGAVTPQMDVMSAEYYRNVPIIALSGDTSQETREKFKEAGINDFTDKPVDMKKLKTKMIHYLPQEEIRYGK